MNDVELRFVDGLRGMIGEVSRNETNKGFRQDEDSRYFTCGPDGNPVQVDLSGVFLARRLALIHSEISEALEVSRRDWKDIKDIHCPDYLNLEIELADAMIRIMTTAQKCGLRLGPAIVAKAEFNRSRPILHGKKY